jgi:hypothetical protein
MEDAFSYLSILTSIVLGIGITRLLLGIGTVVQERQRIHIYWVHLLWTLNLFLFFALNWWILFRWQTQQEWNFFLFLFLLLSPIVTFLLTVILYPDRLETHMEFKAYFYQNHRWFFALAALLPPLDLVDTLLKGYAHFLAQGPLYIVTILLIFILSVIASYTKNETYHKVFSVFFLIYLSIFISINLSVLS